MLPIIHKKGFFLADSLHCLLTKELQVICVKTKKKKTGGETPKTGELVDGAIIKI